MINPLLPHQYKPDLLSFPAYVQPRLTGGQRVIYQDGRFQDMEKDKSHGEILQPLSAIFGDHVILDGMLIPYKDGIRFFVFDVVDYQKPFKQRMSPVYEVIRDTRHLLSTVIAVPSRRVKTMEEADLAYQGYWESGIIYRIAPCLYLKSNAKHNRSWQLLERRPKAALQLLERKRNDTRRTLSKTPLDRQKGG